MVKMKEHTQLLIAVTMAVIVGTFGRGNRFQERRATHPLCGSTAQERPCWLTDRFYLSLSYLILSQGYGHPCQPWCQARPGASHLSPSATTERYLAAVFGWGLSYPALRRFSDFLDKIPQGLGRPRKERSLVRSKLVMKYHITFVTGIYLVAFEEFAMLL